MKAGLPALAARSACERLAQSRLRLQRALIVEPGTLAGATKDKTIPGLNLAMEVAKAWWSRHAYRLAAVTLQDTANAAVLPTAQRHPLGLVAGAFVVGGLLAWSRPWRWFPLKAVLSIAAQSER